MKWGWEIGCWLFKYPGITSTLVEGLATMGDGGTTMAALLFVPLISGAATSDQSTDH